MDTLDAAGPDLSWVPSAISAVFAGLSMLFAFATVRRANRRAKANIRLAYSSISDGTHIIHVKNVGPAGTLEFGAAVEDDKGRLYRDGLTENVLPAGGTWTFRTTPGVYVGKRFTVDLRWLDTEGRRRHRVYWLPVAPPGSKKASGRGSLAPPIAQSRMAPNNPPPIRMLPWVGLYATRRMRRGLLREQRARAKQS